MNYRVGIVLVSAGALLGIGLSEGLHAQASKPAFSVSIQGEPIDAAKMQTIADKLIAGTGAAGAKPIARGGKVVSVDGTKPGRVVIQQWPSLDAAVKYYNADETKKLFQERNANLKGYVGTFVVEGL